MEYEVREYVDMLMEGLQEQLFFEQTPIAPELMRKEILNKIDRNLNSIGDYRLSESDMIDVYDKCVEIHIADSIAQALLDGDIEIKGIDPDGELLYGPKEIQTQTVTAYFERIGPYGPWSLN